jgi:hypothetical protein
MKTIKEILIQEMNTENRIKSVPDQKRIIERFNELDAFNQDKVNDIFIFICGYSLKTLIEKSQEI